MTIELPDQDLDRLHLSPAEARLELAVGLYAGRRVTLGQAAKIAAVPYATFMHELGRRGICLNYTAEDLQHDIEMARQLADKTSAA